MVDERPPVDIPLPGDRPIRVSMKRTAGSGPVLTGDHSKFSISVDNSRRTQPLKGVLHLEMGLGSPTPAWGANPKDLVRFEVAAGKTREFPVRDQWLFVEGKAVYVLTGLDLEGLRHNTHLDVTHPLASFTVFERSTYTSQRNRSWITLLLAATAAVASTIAALVALHV